MERVLVRDSKDPDGPVLLFTADEWSGVIADIGAGRTPVGVCWYSVSEIWEWVRDGVTLRFTGDEWSAFKAGVLAGEFDVETLARERPKAVEAAEGLIVPGQG
jgi:hypothetical protein